MPEEKKRWVPVCFPMGPFTGSVNIAVKGEHVITAEDAKKLIDLTEGQINAGELHTTSLHSKNASSGEGSPKVQQEGSLCPGVHTDKND